MLVLSRKKNEGIIETVPPSAFPTVIRIAVVDIRGDKVRIGFDADPEVIIHRAEVQARVDAEQQDVAGDSATTEPARIGPQA